GGRTRGQSQALPGRAALHRWVSACRFLFARAGKNSPGEEISPQGTPVALLRDPIYYYNMGCYDALLGNPKSAQVHLLTSFKMDPSLRAIAKKDPDLESVQELI